MYGAATRCELCSGKPVASQKAMKAHRLGPRSCIRAKGAATPRTAGGASRIDAAIAKAVHASPSPHASAARYARTPFSMPGAGSASSVPGKMVKVSALEALFMMVKVGRRPETLLYPGTMEYGL